jgi:hypothetical protein
MQPLNNENFKTFAASHYDNTACLGSDEFTRDLQIPNKISNSIQKILNNDPKGNIRILVNYIITFYNVFKNVPARELLFFMVAKESLPGLKTILVSLHKIRQDYREDIEECPELKELIKKEFGLYD